MNTEELPKRVYVNNIASPSEWNRIQKQAAAIGLVAHVSKLVPSSLEGYFFGFITMKYHTKAKELIAQIGTIPTYEKRYFDSATSTNRIDDVPQVYANWAETKNPRDSPPRKK